MHLSVDENGWIGNSTLRWCWLISKLGALECAKAVQNFLIWKVISLPVWVLKKKDPISLIFFWTPLDKNCKTSQLQHIRIMLKSCNYRVGLFYKFCTVESILLYYILLYNCKTLRVLGLCWLILWSTRRLELLYDYSVILALCD